MSKTFEVIAVHQGRWWIITVPELEAVTQARNVREIDRMATGLVEALLDLDEGDAVVHVRIELPKSVADTWREAAELQQRAAAAERRVGRTPPPIRPHAGWR